MKTILLLLALCLPAAAQTNTIAPGTPALQQWAYIRNSLIGTPLHGDPDSNFVKWQKEILQRLKAQGATSGVLAEANKFRDDCNKYNLH